MIPNNRLLLRQASRIHRLLYGTRPNKKKLTLPLETWQQCQDSVKRLHIARQCGWQHASKHLEQELLRKLSWIRGELYALEPLLSPQSASPQISLRDFYADLVALHQEFDHVTIRLKEKSISVTTEPIELSGIYLGPFEICLSWESDDAECPFSYRVIAVDPHPAASNDSVAHPHVQSEELCEGEGRMALRLALQQGRWMDFFTIVANLLRTYNAASPYVALADWEGVDCSDCGRTVSDEDRWSCEKCGSSVCDQCYYCCPECDSIFCSSCVSPCDTCSEYYCHACLKVCSACLVEVCKECLNEQERCTACQDKAAKTDEASEEAESIKQDESTDSEVQSTSLGETAVPA